MTLLRRAGLALCLALPAAASAQVADGDAAWTDGRLADARAAYERELAANPSSVRSLYRLAVLAGQAGELDSALVFLGRARGAEPDEPDVRLLEAQVLALAGRLDASVAKYDSLLALDPGRREARLGRARVLSWRGDLEGAAGGYRSILAQDAHDAEARVGLGQVYHWQGRDELARRQIDSALAIDPGNRTGREIGGALRAARRPQADVSLEWSSDSDENTTLTLGTGASVTAVPGVRLFGSAFAGRAEDPVREARRAGGEAGLTVARGRAQVTGAVGARRLSVDELFAAPRTGVVYRAGAGLRVGALTSLGLSYAHVPFDETARLVAEEHDLETLDLSLETALSDGTGISLGAGGAWVSDGNSRRSAVLGVTRTLARRFFVGALGRVLGYDARGAGYFSPSRFAVGEVRGGWRLAARQWDARLSGGVGAQQIKGLDAQPLWHLEARLGRKWGTLNVVEAFAGVTNSVGVTSGLGDEIEGYRYRSAGLRLRLGL